MSEDKPKPKKKWVKREKAPYTQEIADFIVQESYFYTLTKICALYEKMPSRPTIYHWLKTKEDFRDAYNVAVISRTQSLMDELEDMSNSVDAKNANAMKVAKDVKQWVLEKQMPTKYGDHKFITQHTTTVKEEVKHTTLDDLRNVPVEMREMLRQLADMASANKPVAMIEKKDDIEDVEYVEVKKDSA